MRKYRIDVYHYADGAVRYMPMEKFFGVWVRMNRDTVVSLEAAQAAIDKDYRDYLGSKVVRVLKGKVERKGKV